jgi:hypothetical protein
VTTLRKYEPISMHAQTLTNLILCAVLCLSAGLLAQVEVRAPLFPFMLFVHSSCALSQAVIVFSFGYPPLTSSFNPTFWQAFCTSSIMEVVVQPC